MAAKLRTVNGVHLSNLKKFAIYVFGARKYKTMIQDGYTVTILVDQTTGDTEIARFQEAFGVTIEKMKSKSV